MDGMQQFAKTLEMLAWIILAGVVVRGIAVFVPRRKTKDDDKN